MDNVNSLIYHFLGFPLEGHKFEKEEQCVKVITVSNGYSSYLFDKTKQKRRSRN